MKATTLFATVLAALLFTTSANSQKLPRLLEPVRPLTGDELIERNVEYLKGRHQLVVENNSGQDAIVKVEEFYSKEAYRLVYVRAGDAYTIAEIRDGSFQFKFALGSDYSPETGMFQRNASFTKFETVRVFETQTFREGDWIRTRSSQIRITLAPVPGGKASTKKIRKEEF